MKLNSKIPILIISFTVVFFLALSVSSNKNKPYINTISGNIENLDDLNISIINSDESMYFNKKYIIDKYDVSKVKAKKINYTNYHSIYIDMIDITCGQDLISNIGYEVDYSNENEEHLSENKITFFIDERKNNKENTILPNQGEDKIIYDGEIDKSDIKRSKINIKSPIKYKDVHAKILGSNRYKNDLYIASNYYTPNNNGSQSVLEISKLNNDKSKLEKIKTINLIKEMKNKYKTVDPVYSYKQKDKFYILIDANNTTDGNVSTNSDYYLLEYSINDNEYKIDKINNYNGTYIINSKFEKNNLNLTLGKNIKGFEIINIDYDINKKEIINEFEFSLENISKDYNERFLEDIVTKDNNLYLILSDKNYFIEWKGKKPKIYVINKETNAILYEGEIVNSIGDNSIKFEEK